MTQCVCINNDLESGNKYFEVDKSYEFTIYGDRINIDDYLIPLNHFKNHFSYLKDSKGRVVI